MKKSYSWAFAILFAIYATIVFTGCAFARPNGCPASHSQTGNPGGRFKGG